MSWHVPSQSRRVRTGRLYAGARTGPSRLANHVTVHLPMPAIVRPEAGAQGSAGSGAGEAARAGIASRTGAIAHLPAGRLGARLEDLHGPGDQTAVTGLGRDRHVVSRLEAGGRQRRLDERPHHPSGDACFDRVTVTTFVSGVRVIERVIIPCLGPVHGPISSSVIAG